MKISLQTSLNRQDFPEAENWISKLLYPLQLFMDTVTKALTNNLTLSDNLSCVIQNFILVAGATDIDNTYTFNCNLGRTISEFSYYCNTTDGTYPVIYPQISWNFINNKIVINGIKGLTTGVKYNFTITVK
jgi:hypothetical protein